MTNYIFFPRFETDEDFTVNALQATYYLSAHLVKESRIFYEGAVNATITSAPDFFDKKTVSIYKKHKASLIQSNLSDIKPLLDTNHETLILCWDNAELDAARAFAKSLASPAPRIVRIDRLAEQSATSFYLKLTSNEGTGNPQQIAKSRKQLDALFSSLKKSKTYIFGTGPTLDEVDMPDLSDGNVLVTNSMVKNLDFIKATQPNAIVASDPIFHAGCSAYAAEFRKLLITALDACDAYFVFPMRDIGVYSTILPKRLQNRLIAIPLINTTAPNLNLRQSLWVRSVPNVMTLLLLPLAASFGDTIVMAGFDGRPLSDDSYYWKHSTKNQITGEMDSIQQAHPAFFSLSYQDYYLSHLSEVQNYFDALREKGKTLISITDAFIPAVKGVFSSNRAALTTTQPSISIIVPCYNSERLLPETIKSILCQNFDDFELILINDGSTDSTLNLLHHWAALDSRIIVIDQENAGVSQARNTGLAHARGKYICFSDADDLLPANSLKSRFDALDSLEGPSMVFGRYTFISPNGRNLNLIAGSKKTVQFKHMIEYPLNICSIMGSATIMKAFRFEKNMANGEDWLYISNITRSGHDFLPVDAIVYSYRFHKSSVTQQNMIKHVLSLSDVHAYIGADKFHDDPLISDKWRSGLDATLIQNSQTKRLYMLAADTILRGDINGAQKVCEIIEQKTHGNPPEKINLSMIERSAVRVFLEPFESIELYQALNKDSNKVKQALGTFGTNKAHNEFKNAVSALLNRAKIKSQPVIIFNDNAPAANDVNAEKLAKEINALRNSIMYLGDQNTKPLSVKNTDRLQNEIEALKLDIAKISNANTHTKYTSQQMSQPRPASWRLTTKPIVIIIIAFCILGATLAYTYMHPSTQAYIGLALLMGLIGGYAIQILRNLLRAKLARKKN